MGCASELRLTRVLVIEDERYILEYLSKMLAGYGYDVCAASGQEASLELLRVQAVDILLYGLCGARRSQGLQFTRQLCQMHPDIPVVVMASAPDKVIVESCFEAGASDFLVKPPDAATLPFVLENNLQRKKLELRRLHEQRAEVLLRAIRAIATAIESRDKGDQHGCMAELCLGVGTELGLSQDELDTLELAACVHDIGKLQTPMSVLAKPGRLTDEEWADILKHPVDGAGYFQGIDELAEVASIIRHHHEHYDGSGYPDGLRGEAISLPARIISVADAFGAMTSDRPYRRTMSLEDATVELRTNSGTQFDPLIVDAAISVIEREYLQKKATGSADQPHNETRRRAA